MRPTDWDFIESMIDNKNMNTQQNWDDNWQTNRNSRRETTTNPAHTALEWYPGLRGGNPTNYVTAYRADTNRNLPTVRNHTIKILCVHSCCSLYSSLPFHQYSKSLQSSVFQFVCFPPRIIDIGQNRIWWSLIIRISTKSYQCLEIPFILVI